MRFWSAYFALPVHAWRPLGLAALAPLVLVAVVIPLSRWHGRGIATVLALRTVVVLAIGFATLAAVASVAVVNTGLGELAKRHDADVRSLAELVERSPFGLLAADAQIRISLLRARDPSLGFVVGGTDACRASCMVGFAEQNMDPGALKQAVASAWPRNPTDGNTIALGGHPYLLVEAPVRGMTGETRSAVVAGVNAQPLADQAARTTWLLLGMSYGLLVLVGLTSWQQVSHSLAKRIEAIQTQLRSGIADESHESFDVAGHELRELADSVSAYIKRTLEEKSSSDERYRKLVELAPDAVLMCADTQIRVVNPAAIALAGAKSRTDLVGSPIERFLVLEDRRRDSKSGAPRPGTFKRLDGAVRHVEVAEITDASGGEVLQQYLVRDITHRRAREAALAHRADHDPLTGLVNRARFEAALEEMLASTRAPWNPNDERHIVAIYVDLDDFKPVNDTHGHAAGDAVLVAVADRLRESTRATDVIARLGGDEFAVLLEVRDLSEVRIVADRILAAIREPTAAGNAVVSVGASLGVASTRTHGRSGSAGRPLAAAELLKAADAAMYAAKSEGGNDYRISAPEDQSPPDRSGVNFGALV